MKLGTNFITIEWEKIIVNNISNSEIDTTIFISLFRFSILYRSRKCFMKSRENITIRFWDISSIYRSLEKPYISFEWVR